MARIFDVIEHPSELRDEIVHRFPESGIGDYCIGSQVIVREAQAVLDGIYLEATFHDHEVFRNGKKSLTV